MASGLTNFATPAVHAVSLVNKACRHKGMAALQLLPLARGGHFNLLHHTSAVALAEEPRALAVPPASQHSTTLPSPPWGCPPLLSLVGASWALL